MWKSSILFFFSLTLFCAFQNDQKVLWQIGMSDNSCSEFALAPDQFEQFIENDFGWEDKYFLIGASEAKLGWPYVLPGPSDKWGGTWSTSGWRSHTLNILFGIENLPNAEGFTLIVDLFDINTEDPPVFKITINGKSWKYELPGGSGNETIQGNSLEGKEHIIELSIPANLMKVGGNEINLTTIQGSWLLFDQVRFVGPATTSIKENKSVFIRSVEISDYVMPSESGNVQPLLVDVEHLSGSPELEVLVDNAQLLSTKIETGRYTLEAPMPAVDAPRNSKYSIWVNGAVIDQGEILRSPQKQITLADYVDTKMGTAHSRWMIAPGPWMPFSMVKLSPDNQNGGWQAGYDPIFESIGGFSHIHEWTMSGLSLMPTNGALITTLGDQKKPDDGYRSRIDKETEEAPIGYYSVDLTDYGIKAELSATTRCGFHRYTFPKEKGRSRVLVDLKNPAEYDYILEEVQIEKVSENRVEGFSKQLSPNAWSLGISQEYIVHFVLEFDQPIKNHGVWTEQGVQGKTSSLSGKELEDAGAYFEFDTKKNGVVQVRTAISYVSIENASENLDKEISTPFGWDFQAVRNHHLDTWNELFKRIKISTNDRREKMRFYTNMYRALCSRNVFSDVNGQWVDADEQVRQLDDPNSPALGCDAFWNTFWNLNQFWNLVTPQWSNRWVKSQLAMYDAGGWLAKGPAGMEYIPVMVAEHEIPLIVSAYQMGIRDYDLGKAFDAVKKMQTLPGEFTAGGFAGNRDLKAYLEYKYVPQDKGRFSNSLEYSFDDWTVGQFAKSIGAEKDYQYFNQRGYYWKNVIDTTSGYARLKSSDGTWLDDFDPYKSGANRHYVEGNAWQLTFFVPQDVPALAQMIGKDRFVERLDWGFTESEKTRFNGKNDQYWNYPVVQGNQQSMHFAFLFNWVDRPWLTQKWSRSIIDRYYGYGVSNAYLGDEDQGQMSAWFIMASLGLFQTDGGCRSEPIYEIASPLFEKVEIDLGEHYGRGDKIIIEARNASRLNKYVQSAKLNGNELKDFKFPAYEILKGGKLELVMGPEPNKLWGVISEK